MTKSVTEWTRITPVGWNSTKMMKLSREGTRYLYYGTILRQVPLLRNPSVLHVMYPILWQIPLFEKDATLVSNPCSLILWKQVLNINITELYKGKYLSENLIHFAWHIHSGTYLAVIIFLSGVERVEAIWKQILYVQVIGPYRDIYLSCKNRGISLAKLMLYELFIRGVRRPV